MAARTLLIRSALFAALFAVAACGRAGPLEPPPASSNTQTGQPGETEPEPQGRPFILDALIE